jgi:hypothetical protein
MHSFSVKIYFHVWPNAVELVYDDIGIRVSLTIKIVQVTTNLFSNPV